MYLLDTLMIPMWWWQVIAAGFGVIIGSFLNVYIYRFNTGKSLAGHSHCLSCGQGLRWYELFPLISYLVLRARCGHCGCYVTSRYFWVELLTGGLFAATLLLTQDLVLILLYWWLFSVLVAITVYDLVHFIIPDRLTVILTTLLLGQMVYQYVFQLTAGPLLLAYIYTALGGAAFFLVLWLYSRGRWLGFGDVKLAFPLALMVGPAGVFSFVILSFWIGAVVSLLLIGLMKLKRGKAGLQLSAKALTMKSAVPFAPFLVASSLVVLFTKFNVLELFSFI